jgi:hypothetical protein
LSRVEVSGKIGSQVCHFKANLLLLVCLRLTHDIEDPVHVQPTCLAQLFQLLCLGEGWCAIFAFHGFQQVNLFRFSKVGQFHCRGEGDLAFIHHLQDAGDQIG